MKRYYKYLIAFAVLIVVVLSCITITNFSHPESAPVNSNVNVAIDIQGSPLEDRAAKVIVAMLVPLNWNTDNIMVTYSSQDLAGGPYVNMPMRKTTTADIEPTGSVDWVSSLTSKFGKKGNYEPVQWVAFIGERELTWNNKVQFTGTVNIKFKTGSENIKVNLAYFISNSYGGIYPNATNYILRQFLFQTTGGDNPLIDYTIPDICSVGPEDYTFKDILRLNYNATVQVDDKDSPLKGADEVFFIAKATYDNGTKSVEVSETSAKTLMHKEDKDRWFIYFYPLDHFSLPANTKIDNISYYLTNRDKNIAVRLPNGNDFGITENCN